MALGASMRSAKRQSSAALWLNRIQIAHFDASADFPRNSDYRRRMSLQF
jgi:hypothetical protein